MKLIRYTLLILLVCVGFSCNDQYTNRQQVEHAARSALDAMTQLQRNGGWAMAWAEDGSATFGEWLLREDDIIAIQPPATPGIGMTFLKAYEVLGDSAYLSIAVSAGDALIEGQLPHGGFSQEFYPDLRRQDSTWYQNKDGSLWVPQVPGADIFLERGSGTFDDETTQYATRYLLELGTVTGKKRFYDAARRGVDFMLEAQYSNGCWPQKYPLQDNYTRYITLNDEAMMDVMRILIYYTEVTGDSLYYRAAIRGADCLLKLQGNPPQAGWAQQYQIDGDAGWGRPWEPPALSSRASINVLQALLDIYMITGEKEYLQKGYNTFEWLISSRLDKGHWAMYYELVTNKPIYARADREITYQYKEALEYRPGYSWHVDHDLSLKETYEKLLATPVDEREQVVAATPVHIDTLRTEALEAASTLNENGYWTRDMEGETLKFYRQKFGAEKTVPVLIHSGSFVRYMTRLLNYLERSDSQ